MKALALILCLIGQRERQTDTPALDGQAADVQINERYHIRNEGSSVDGAGLCVNSSMIIAGAHQNVLDMRAGKFSKLWIDGMKHPGGSYPEKLTAQLQRVYGDVVPWAQKTISRQSAEQDFAMMEALTKKGYAVCSTINTGELYDMKPIHHWITLQQFRRGNGWSAWVDNNKPGITFWLQGFEKRVIDGQTGWVGWWTQLGGDARRIATKWFWGIMPGAAFLFFVAVARRRWTVCPVAPALLLVMCFAGTSSAQSCPPGTVCPNPRNYVQADGTYVMYPATSVESVQPGVSDWADRYESYTDPSGKRWLRARVTSRTYGKGTIYYLPDSWDQPVQPQPVKPDPTPRPREVTEQLPTGVMIEELSNRATPVESLDPSWNPETVGITDLGVHTHFDAAVRKVLPIQWGIVGFAAAAFLAAVVFRLMINGRRRAA